MSTILKLSQWLLIPMILMTSVPQSAAAFSDVEPGDGNYVAITYLEQQGIINGYEDGTFRPTQSINRAEALKMLTLASGLFSEDQLATVEIKLGEIEQPFSDTPLEAWYTKYLIEAKNRGIIDGYEDNSFKPEQTINLAEALKMYLEAHENLAYPLTNDWLFADTPTDSWFINYTAYAASRGMVYIWNDNKIHPAQEMTRGYMAELIYRKLKFKEGYTFGKATFYSAWLNGNGSEYKAAHKTLPFGTIVEVTNLDNGKSVQVEINDRGPYGPGRVIDLSTGAFAAIGSTSTGVLHIQYKVIE